MFDTRRNTEGESKNRFITDIEARRHGEQIRLETLVVHAINDGCLV
jgi:hypothetical protein